MPSLPGRSSPFHQNASSSGGLCTCMVLGFGDHDLDLNKCIHRVETGRWQTDDDGDCCLVRDLQTQQKTCPQQPTVNQYLNHFVATVAYFSPQLLPTARSCLQRKICHRENACLLWCMPSFFFLLLEAYRQTSTTYIDQYFSRKQCGKVNSVRSE